MQRGRAVCPGPCKEARVRTRAVRADGDGERMWKVWPACREVRPVGARTFFEPMSKSKKVNANCFCKSSIELSTVTGLYVPVSTNLTLNSVSPCERPIWP